MNLESGIKQYKSNGHITYSCQYHVVFTTKYRRKVLIDGIAVRLKALINEQQSVYGYNIIEMEVMPNHVHLLIDSNPKDGIFNQINQIKGYTSRMLRTEFPQLRSRLPCLWTRANFISTCGAVSLESVNNYIENQKNV